MSTCSCKVICSNNVCINPQHFTTPSTETIMTLRHFYLLTKVDLPLLLIIFIWRWIFFWIERHLFMFWHVHPIFHLVIFQIWCMNFEIVLSLMIFVLALISFLKYVGTLCMVMFLHQYHTYLLDRDYQLWRNKPKTFDPL